MRVGQTLRSRHDAETVDVDEVLSELGEARSESCP
jgi:hypothetical protein